MDMHLFSFETLLQENIKKKKKKNILIFIYDTNNWIKYKKPDDNLNPV